MGRERVDTKVEEPERPVEIVPTDHAHTKPHFWDADDGSSFLRGWEHFDYDEPPFVPLHLVNHCELAKHPSRYRRDRKRQLQSLRSNRRFAPQAGLYHIDPISPPAAFSDSDLHEPGSPGASPPQPASPKSSNLTFEDSRSLPSLSPPPVTIPERDGHKQKPMPYRDTRQARPQARPGRHAPWLPLIGSSKVVSPLTPTGGILPNPLRRSRTSCAQFCDISVKSDSDKLLQCLDARGKGRRYSMVPMPASRKAITFGLECRSEYFEDDDTAGPWEDIWHARRSSFD
eukprot:jgi/Mesvir1/28949/Mv17727-RA.1